jgi:hypothetical protein
MTIETKLCTLCSATKPLTEFAVKKNTKPASWCKQCVRDRAKTYYKNKNPNARTLDEMREKYGSRKLDTKNYMRRYNWIKNYNLTDDRIQEILSTQNNQCPICLTTFTEDNIFSVDHDHTCCVGVTSCGNCIRGFLCTSCNTGLGKLKDDVQILERAVQYLEDNPFYDRRRS